MNKTEHSRNKYESKIGKLPIFIMKEGEIMDQQVKELEQQIVQLQLKALIQKAYEQGIKDGQTKYSHPKLLTRTEAMELLRCSTTKISELMARPDFPVNREVGVKIPYHMLMQWIENNTQWVDENTNYYNQEVM